MSNDYYSHSSGVPSTNSQGSSATMRTEFEAIGTAFDKLPPLSGNADEMVAINPGGDGQTSYGAAAARALIGAQQQADTLDDIGGLTPTDGGIIVGDGSNFGLETGATARASIGAQAAHQNLADIASLTPSDGGIIVGDGSNFGLETGSTARASIGAQAAHQNLSDLAGIAPTKGRVLVGDGSNWVYLGVGADGKILQADSTQAGGVSWVPMASEVVTDTSTGGTTYTVTGIPAWATEVDVIFNNVGITGTNDIRFRLGNSGGLVTSGYAYSNWSLYHSAGNSASSGTFLPVQYTSGDNVDGVLRMNKADDDTWKMSGYTSVPDITGNRHLVTGTLDVGAPLDRLSVYATTGTFDSGKFTVRWR